MQATDLLLTLALVAVVLLVVLLVGVLLVLEHFVLVARLGMATGPSIGHHRRDQLSIANPICATAVLRTKSTRRGRIGWNIGPTG